MKAILEWRGIKVEYMKAKEADPATDTVALAQRPWDAPDLEELGLDLNINWAEDDDDYVDPHDKYMFSSAYFYGE